MDKVQLKDYYRRFKQWQEQPFEYKLGSDEVQHCNNCGNEYKGNFCPICSQKAGMGRIGWRSVRQGVMDIWGLGTRSLLYSIWQLLLRPGHIIAEYIEGKRQVSFPPVKMLFIIAVLYSMIFYWFFPDVLGISLEVEATKEQQEILGDFDRLSKTYYSWYALIMAMLAVLPTWVMFRFSPRHTAHTLPEGFFIQVFLAILMIVFSFLLIPIAMIDKSLYLLVIYGFYGIYYLIVYKYLFGYSLWGTLWRSGFVLSTVIFLMGAIVLMLTNIGKAMSQKVPEANISEEQILFGKMVYVGGSTLLAFMVLGVGYLFNLIATRKSRRALRKVKQAQV